MKLSGFEFSSLVDYGKKGIDLADKTGATQAGWDFAADKAKGTIFEKLLPGTKTQVLEKKVVDKKLIIAGAAALGIMAILLLRKK